LLKGENKIKAIEHDQDGVDTDEERCIEIHPFLLSGLFSEQPSSLLFAAFIQPMRNHQAVYNNSKYTGFMYKFNFY